MGSRSNENSSTPGARLSRRVWSAIYLLNWAIIAVFWLYGSKDMFGSVPEALVALARISGLAAAYMILLQFFFMGRMPYLERAFGLDGLSRLHHANGERGFALLILHPILISVGYGALLGTGPVKQFLAAITSGFEMAAAFVGLVLFIVVAVTSIIAVLRKFRYETWRFIHFAAYLAVLGSFFHQIEFGHTITSNNIFYAYWIALYLVVFGSHLVFRFARPVYMYMKHGFTVSKIVPETDNAVSIYMDGRDLDKFKVIAGQFMIFRFLTKGRWWQAHPFSLSKTPDGLSLRITVKDLGDFTHGIKEVPIGTKVMIEGPYGIFTGLFSLRPKVLLIAGGIGVTPIRSLAGEMISRGKDVAMLYGNRNISEIVFKDELQSLQGRNFKLVHVISEGAGSGSVTNGGEVEKGIIDGEKIKRLVPDFRERDIFVCGPTGMIDSVIGTLRELGASRSQIFYEKFVLG